MPPSLAVGHLDRLGKIWGVRMVYFRPQCACGSVSAPLGVRVLPVPDQTDSRHSRAHQRLPGLRRSPAIDRRVSCQACRWSGVAPCGVTCCAIPSRHHPCVDALTEATEDSGGCRGGCQCGKPQSRTQGESCVMIQRCRRAYDNVAVRRHICSPTCCALTISTHDLECNRSLNPALPNP